MGRRRIASPERKTRRIEAQRKRRAVAKLVRKPKARYTLFVVICKQRQNNFFAKKFEFHETGRKHVYILFAIDSSFRKYEFHLLSHEKETNLFVCS